MYKVTLTKSIRKPNKKNDIEAWLDWTEGYRTASIEVEIPKDDAITMASYIQNKQTEVEEKAVAMAERLLENGSEGQKKFARVVLKKHGAPEDYSPADWGMEQEPKVPYDKR